MYLNIQKLVKYYNKDNPIIKELDFSVKKGEFVSFIGESGSGKTTFLKCLAGLEKINSGKITLNNKILNDKDIFIKPHLRKIGFIFQDYPLFPHLNALDNIKINLKESYFTNIDYYIDLMGLSNLLKRFPHELSGGEQQRVAIARALIAKTNLILADEPTGNLDYKTSKEIFSYFLKLKKLKKTIIFATHNRELANRADYKLFISNGDIKRVNAR